MTIDLHTLYSLQQWDTDIDAKPPHSHSSPKLHCIANTRKQCMNSPFPGYIGAINLTDGRRTLQFPIYVGVETWSPARSGSLLLCYNEVATVENERATSPCRSYIGAIPLRNKRLEDQPPCYDWAGTSRSKRSTTRPPRYIGAIILQKVSPTAHILYSIEWLTLTTRG